MNFEDVQNKVNDAYDELKRMNRESLILFSQTHDLKMEISHLHDIKAAQKYSYYNYCAKLCALNALNMPLKWFNRLKDAKKKFSDSAIVKNTPLNTEQRGARQALIRNMLLEGKARGEIKNKIAELFPEIPLANIGCQIAAVICCLKRKGVKYENNNNKKV